MIGISSDWEILKSLDGEMREDINSVTKLFMKQISGDNGKKWLKEIRNIEKNLVALTSIMHQVMEQINKREPEGITEIWNKYKGYSTDLQERLSTLQQLGIEHLSTELQTTWEKDWKTIFDKFSIVLQLAEGSSLHLSMINELAPEELDELSVTIVEHMPKSYTLEEAMQYEKEYMEAYEAIKKEASQKKNLWDRFLDILAGGIQQTPAERVMMQRWINGEKGNL